VGDARETITHPLPLLILSISLNLLSPSLLHAKRPTLPPQDARQPFPVGRER